MANSENVTWITDVPSAGGCEMTNVQSELDAYFELLSNGFCRIPDAPDSPRYPAQWVGWAGGGGAAPAPVNENPHPSFNAHPSDSNTTITLFTLDVVVPPPAPPSLLSRKSSSVSPSYIETKSPAPRFHVESHVTSTPIPGSTSRVYTHRVSAGYIS